MSTRHPGHPHACQCSQCVDKSLPPPEQGPAPDSYQTIARDIRVAIVERHNKQARIEALTALLVELLDNDSADARRRAWIALGRRGEPSPQFINGG